jgi:flavin reductase (DIM6/NTAB) family NADH-FMN oxidoreductase RutF
MSAFVTFTPGEIPQPRLHSYLIGAIAPRPIALASTMDAQGRPNLAPFSFFNVFSSNPPVCVFSPARKGRDGTLKNTYDNVMEVPEVVINVVTYPMLYQVNLASVEFPKGENEFEASGLTPVASELIRPFRVKESPVQFECKVTEVKSLGVSGGAGNLIFAEVVKIHIAENMLTAEGALRIEDMDLVGRMGRDFWVRAQGHALIEIEKALLPPVIGFMGLPEDVRNSKVLTGNDLGRLANMAALPSSEEVDVFLADASSTGLFSGLASPEDMHQRAQSFLADGDKKTAWLLLLAGKKMW